MAERFHSIRQDDISKIYMNCNANQITTQTQLTPINQHMQPQRYFGTELTSLASALKSDFDYLTNARLYSTPISRSVVDLNNNRISLSEYSVNNYTTMNSQNAYHNHHHIPTLVTNRHYPNANQLNQNSFHHNRFMPYSRSTYLANHHDPNHQTNSIISGGLPSNNRYYGMAQCSETVFPICPSPLMAPLCYNGPLVQMPATTTSLHCTTPSTASSLTQNLLAPELNYVAVTGKTTSTIKDQGSSCTAVAQSTTNKSLVTSLGMASSANVTPARSTCAPTSPNATADTVTLQITNLDYSMDEASLRAFLLGQLEPITPVISLIFEGSSYAKVSVPDMYFAKLVVSNLHRKKIGHKRMLVSYTRDSSLTEFNTLRCQVAGLLKDVPSYTLPMYKFRELFQSRFKTSISVLDLYKMPDICIIKADNNEDKFISLHPELVNSFESSPLMEGLQHSVPYCTIHFKREQHKGWAEQEIEPLPNVCMSIAEIENIIHPLLKTHAGDIPIASLVHCIEGQLNTHIIPDENGVNLEHLVCCVQGIQIQVNNFGIKILTWVDINNNNNNKEKENINAAICALGGGGSISNEKGNSHGKNPIAEALHQISREVMELVKMSPKATMKFNRFIPAYHNHFGKQCRVADYGYTKLIELFEALSPVIQIMGDGENRQITLTHRIQVRRFTSDLLRILRTHWSKSILLSQLPTIFAQTQNRQFDITDYGVCELTDIFDGLVNTNIVLIMPAHGGKDLLISMPKREQTSNELEKTCVFAGEVVELFRNAPQYSILFQKFVRSYHYHFGYQCRLSDYGFLRLADLLDAINGVVEIELTSDEDKKISLSPVIARRIFAKQCEELIRDMTGSPNTCVKLDEVLKMHKKKFGYQMQSHALGAKNMTEAVQLIPYVELIMKGESSWIICHGEEKSFRNQSYRACKYLLALEGEKCELKGENFEAEKTQLTLKNFISNFNEKHKEDLTETKLRAMKHAIELKFKNNEYYPCLTNFIKFLMSIVCLLESKSSMTVLEIKSVLDCDIQTISQYGYPSLYSLITSHTDIFNAGPIPTQEKAVVTLVKNTEMHLKAFANNKSLFDALKLPFSKQKAMRSTRTPLSERNTHGSLANNQKPPPVKTRTLSNDVGNTSGNSFQQAVSSNHLLLNVSGKNASNTQNNLSSYSSAHSSLESNALDTSLIASIGKENSLNSSATLSNSFSGSNQSYSSCFTGDLNNSNNNNNLSNINLPPPYAVMPVSSASSALVFTDQIINNQHQQQNHHHLRQAFYSNTNLSDRRHNSAFYQQQIPTYLGNKITNNNELNCTAYVKTTEASTGFYELVNNMRMCPMYQPPKPDTPPADNTPFWIDPIWTNNNNNNSAERPPNDLLNIRLPELRALNVLPMLLSPYSISKIENMKQVFNFESYDRKIA